jgi:hypothetical protein
MSLIQSIVALGPTRILRINNVRRVNRDLGKHSYFLEPASGFGSNRCPTMLMKIVCGLDLRCRRGEFSSMGDADGDAPCSQDLCYEVFGTNAIRLLRLPVGRFNVPLSRVWVSV